MENIIKIIFTVGAILLWFLVKMRKSKEDRKLKEQTFENQNVIEQPEDILPQWDEKPEEEKSEEETQSAVSSSEEITESSLSLETELTQDEKEQKEEKSEEKESTPITIAGMRFSPKNIRYGIIFSEILKRRGENLKK